MIKDGLSHGGEGISSFLMIGQSNMAGRGDFGEVAPIDNPDCYMLRNGRWQKMSEPINPDRSILSGEFHSGVNLAASFADGYAKRTGGRAGLIPCADGGTEIAQWMPGEILFDHAVFMAGLASRTSTVKAILWHQGEADCHPEKILVYKQKFTEMITELRKRLGNPNLPVIIGELSENISDRWNPGDYPARMNKVFEEIAAELHNVALAPAADLPLKSDGIHFSSASLRILGERYLEAYFSIVNK